DADAVRFGGAKAVHAVHDPGERAGGLHGGANGGEFLRAGEADHGGGEHGDERAADLHRGSLLGQGTLRGPFLAPALGRYGPTRGSRDVCPDDISRRSAERDARKYLRVPRRRRPFTAPAAAGPTRLATNPPGTATRVPA